MDVGARTIGGEPSLTRRVAARYWILPALVLLAISAFFVATPTLNLDDLVFASAARDLLHGSGYAAALRRVLLNEDVGGTELRTYGLARAIQIVSASLFRSSPAATYAFVLGVHLAGALVVRRVALLATGDRMTAFLAAATWLGSPAILPFIKAQHHFLYLIAPYGTLLAWVWLASERRLSFPTGVALLTATWMLGEGAILPMAFAVALLAWRQRSRQLLAHGALSGLLLCSHVAHQLLWVRDTRRPQRFTSFNAPSREGLDRFWSSLGQSGRAILGLDYSDAELGGTHLSGLGAIGWPCVAMFLVLAASLLVASARVPDAGRPRRPDVAAALAGVASLSLALYALFALFGIGAVAVRYTTAFFALAPLAAIAITSSIARRVRPARAVASVLAASSLSVSLFLLYRAEVLVSAPNRAALKQRWHDEAIVLRHRGHPVDAAGRVGGGYPGLISPYENGLANPMRSAWTTVLALRLYKDVTVGTACRMDGEGRVEVFYQGASSGLFRADRVRAVGLPERDALRPRAMSLAEACAEP
jgi:hypothetical protein